jgi:hypothetical protein
MIGTKVGVGVSPDRLHGVSALRWRLPARSNLLIRELRESRPYVADEGWRHVAGLMAEAADEIERLNAHIQELEDRRSETRAATPRD